ncbi:MAG: hypothetical protein ACON5H_02760 [Akkermansiaceae bacterium]
MSAKKGDLTLLLPGAEGWEVWKGNPSAGLSLKDGTEHFRVLNVSGIPGGSLQMALPVRQLVALPFKTQTTDLDLIDDLADMHLEKNGVRPALDSGTLSDHFVYEQRAEETSLTAVVLRPPMEGDLPRRSPEAFDLSPRCFSLPPGKVAVWKELGRWVFALGSADKVLYFQCLPGERLDERAGKDIRLSLAQLQLQGLLHELPQELLVWTTGGVSDARPEELDSLARGFGGEIFTAAKPAPHWPVPPSKLLPEDVRAERVQKAAQRTRILAIAAAVIAYLSFVAFLYTKVQRAEKDAIAMERQVEATKGDTGNLQTVVDKWGELSPVVEDEFYPYEVFFQINQCLPNDQVAPPEIRITQATIYNQPKVNEEGLQSVNREIFIAGVAAENADIAKFSIALKAREELSDFIWTIAPQEQTKNGDWSFRYSAIVPQ